MTSNSRMSGGVTIGLDLGDRRSAMCVLDEGGEVVARMKPATTESALLAAVKRYPGARVVMEVGTQSPWVSRLFERNGYDVVVANPWRVRQIAGQQDKSDPIDAELLARLGRVDPALLRPIKHRGEQAQSDRALLRVRDGLVRSRSAMVTQARCIAKSLGKRLPRCDAHNFAKRLDRAAPELRAAFPGLETLLGAVADVTRRIEALDKEIERVCRDRYPETARLRQIPGVGPITAMAYVLTIEEPTRFERSRCVGAYLGLRPKRYQSGASDPELGISKGGDPYVRRMLVQSAHYILGHFGRDTALRRFGERLMKRGGRAARKRAAVAVARKLAVVLHRLWVTGERYEPLRGVTIAAA
ncbi:MAG: IS110 family transposase [Thermodesulfobacteriota bacterium]